MSNSLLSHGLHHTRPPWTSLTLVACSNSCASRWWCHPTISSSVVPISSCLQSCSVSVSYLKSQLLASDGQSNGASASVTVLSMNIQSGFPLGLTGLISLQSKGLSTVFFSTTVWKHQFFGAQTSLWASLVTQRLKCLPAMQETWVRSLDQEDLLEKEMATHSSILAWRIPWTEEPGQLQSIGSQRVGHDWVTSLHFFFLILFIFLFFKF